MQSILKIIVKILDRIRVFSTFDSDKVRHLIHNKHTSTSIICTFVVRYGSW